MITTRLFCCLLIFIWGTLSGPAFDPAKKSNTPKSRPTDIFLISDLLLNPAQNKSLKGKLDIFLNNLSQFNQSPQSYFLPEWFQNTTIIDIFRVKKELENYLVDFYTRTSPKTRPKGEPANTGQIEHINLVLKGFDVIKNLIQYESSLRNDLENLDAVIAEINKFQLERKQWPPASICWECENDWKMIKQIAAYRINFTKFTSGYGRKLHRLFSSIDALQNEKIVICNIMANLKNIKLDRVERDMKYYTWTRTYQSIKDIIKLVNKKMEELCQ